MKVNPIVKTNVVLIDIDAIMDDVKMLRNVYRNYLKFWYLSVDASNKVLLRIKDHGLIDSNVDHTLRAFCWDLPSVGIAELQDARKYIAQQQERTKQVYVVLTSQKQADNTSVLFMDATHHTELPDKFLKVPTFCNAEDLLQHLSSQGLFPFSLDNSLLFDKQTELTKKEGTMVVKEKSTGYYWYLDTFHKTHYEVFDTKGNHLSEAALDGTLIQNSQDKSKKIIL